MICSRSPVSGLTATMPEQKINPPARICRRLVMAVMVVEIEPRGWNG
jgi:hypothetical protein